jgi:nucleotide-binding universal stress UspA family protein
MHASFAVQSAENPMKRILASVDGSPASLHAARMALELAQNTGAQLTLAHVTVPVMAPPDLPFSAPMLQEETQKAGERLLEDVARELGRMDLPRVNLLGNPAELLADLAERESYDLIVVGSKGRGAVSRVLIGSVTDRLVHISKKPVLVVR